MTTLLIVYLAIGAIFLVYVGIDDARRKRISAVGLIGDLSLIHPLIWLLVLALWPVLLLAFLTSADEQENQTAEPNRENEK